jgi:hypothetical protein
MDPDPNPFFSDFKDAKKIFFLYIFSYSLLTNTLFSVFKKLFFVKILFLKQYFSPLNTFMRKGKGKKKIQNRSPHTPPLKFLPEVEISRSA